MPADEYYDELNDRLASEQCCLSEDEIEAEEQERLQGRRDLERALGNYLAAVKRYSKAMVDLGRPCDRKEAA